MASLGESALDVVVRVKSDLSGLNDAKSGLSNLGKNFNNLGNQLGKVGLGLSALAAPAIAFGVISVKEFAKSEAGLKRLTVSILNHKGATQKNVDALEEQAKALQKVGVVEDDSIIAAQTRLAQFDLSTKAIQKLIPSMLDFATAEQGVNLTQEQAINYANGLGKALQGQTDMLVKSGFKFTEQQKNLLKTGTETQRVQALTEILTSTYGGMNEKLRQTTEGGLKNLNNEFGDFKESVGSAIVTALQPLAQEWLPKISTWFQNISAWMKDNPEKFKALATTILTIAGAGVGLTLVGGAFKAIGTAIDGARTAAGLLNSSIGIIGITVAGVVVGIGKMREGFETGRKGAQSLSDALSKSNGAGAIKSMNDQLEYMKANWWNAGGVISGIQYMWKAMQDKEASKIFKATMSDVWLDVKSKIKAGIDMLLQFIGLQKQSSKEAFPEAGAGRIGKTTKKVSVGMKQLGGAVFANSPYIVGEAGPELFMPNSSGSIVPNDRLRAGRASSFVIYQNNIIARPTDMVAAFRELGYRIATV